ncbi:MAG: hypothetical protein MI924_24885 [Chloroflexales bacterium]|nr:hypothetical protein [Chloroflexales bacterium]
MQTEHELTTETTVTLTFTVPLHNAALYLTLHTCLAKDMRASELEHDVLFMDNLPSLIDSLAPAAFFWERDVDHERWPSDSGYLKALANHFETTIDGLRRMRERMEAGDCSDVACTNCAKTLNECQCPHDPTQSFREVIPRFPNHERL